MIKICFAFAVIELQSSCKWEKSLWRLTKDRYVGQLVCCSWFTSCSCKLEGGKKKLQETFLGHLLAEWIWQCFCLDRRALRVSGWELLLTYYTINQPLHHDHEHPHGEYYRSYLVWGRYWFSIKSAATKIGINKMISHFISFCLIDERWNVCNPFEQRCFSCNTGTSLCRRTRRRRHNVLVIVHFFPPLRPSTSKKGQGAQWSVGREINLWLLSVCLCGEVWGILTV